MILAVETSCDETSVALYDRDKNIRSVLVASQVDLFKKFGGVVPEIACRKHVEIINPLLNELLALNKVGWKDIEAVAVTNGPGLIGAVLVGVAVAKTISAVISVPLIDVNHLEAHIYSAFIDNEPSFPLIALIVSGGHTNLVYMKDHLIYKTLGRTKDDAAGEAYDKVSKLLNLDYPGGPLIDKYAGKGDPLKIKFPMPMMDESLNFSYSGLKTAVRNFYEKSGNDFSIYDISAGFQRSAIGILMKKLKKAVDEYNVNDIIICGGVACNSLLRSEANEYAQNNGLNLFIPKPIYCTDNAMMVAVAGYRKYVNNISSSLDLDAYSIREL